MKIMEVFLCKKNRHKSSDKLDIAFERLQKAIHDFLDMPTKPKNTYADSTILVLPVKQVKR